MRYLYLATFLAVVVSVSVLGFRGSISTKPPLEFFPDMDRQAKYHPQGQSRFFVDGRADRPVPVGTVAFGRRTDAQDADLLAADSHTYRGRNADGELASGFPAGAFEDAATFLQRGRENYTIYCAPCHGALGDGNGITKQYGMGATPTFHSDILRGVPEGHIFDIITNGTANRNMLPYADKLSPKERWGVVAYVRALQRAQTGAVADVPPSHKQQLGIQ